MAYSKQVVERFESVLKNPEKHAVGRFDPNDPDVATGMTGAPACGDVMKLDLKLDPETDTILDVKFKTYGCGSAIASSTLFVDMLKGRTITEAKLIKDRDIAKALESPPVKANRMPGLLFLSIFSIACTIASSVKSIFIQVLCYVYVYFSSLPSAQLLD